MARYQLPEPAKADIAAILGRNEDLHSKEACIRYRACLTATMRRIAANPDGRFTVDRTELMPSVRSFHLRHSREESAGRRHEGPSSDKIATVIRYPIGFTLPL